MFNRGQAAPAYQGEEYESDIPKRTALCQAKAKDNDGEWDKIVQFNQHEGRRIAVMAAIEIHKKKEENKKFLDEQVQENERRRRTEERSKMEFVREQKDRLRKLEEEARKDKAREEKIAKMKIDQDEAGQLVKERKAREKAQLIKEDMASLRRLEAENRKAKEKEHAKFVEEQARAKQLKEDLVVQLAAKAAAKQFEAEEEKQLQRQAKLKIEKDEKARKLALEELQDKMKSKQKIGESIQLDVSRIAREDEERGMRHQAAFDAKKRKEEAGRVQAAHLRQQEVLESLEYQLRLKKERAEADRKHMAKEALLQAADAEKAFVEALAVMEHEAKQKRDYFNTLTEHINVQKKIKEDNVGMTKIERQLNSKVLKRMGA